MVFHDGQMHSITRRHLSMPHDNFLCALRPGQINGQHLVGNAEQSVERRLDGVPTRSEEHTSELQSRFDLVCRLLLEKKKKKKKRKQYKKKKKKKKKKNKKNKKRNKKTRINNKKNIRYTEKRQ